MNDLIFFDKKVYHKLWYRLIFKLFPETENRLNQSIIKFHQLYQDRFLPLHNFPSYLMRSELIELTKSLTDYKNSLRWKRLIFSSIFKAIHLTVNQELKFLKQYPQNYLKFQKQKFRDFFNGKETGDSHGLNEEQIDAILINEKENILVAGPGSGKTRVIMDRVGFYSIKQGVPEEEILVLAFNRSAALEVKKRIEDKYGLSKVEIRTFHSLAMKIVHLANKYHEQEIIVEPNAERVIKGIISQFLDSSTEYFIQFHSFFSNYLQKRGFEKIHQKIDQKNQKIIESKHQQNYLTLNGEMVKSIAECEIANFFIKNDIRFEYESLVTWCDSDEQGREYHPDFYLPDYHIYLEHWAFEPGKKPPDWFEDDENVYEQQRKWKISQFKKHGKILWHSYYEQWKAGKLLEVLTDYCKKFKVELKPLARSQLMEKLGIGTQNHHLLADMISSYITAAKNSGYSHEMFKKKVEKSERAVSSYDYFFFKLVEPIFEAYQHYLKQNAKIDFNDMVNYAIEYLDNILLVEAIKPSISYKMVFVDEFQDISPQRFKLLRKILELNPKARLFCVGDDWQAIYGFAGATNKYMIDIHRYFDDCSLNFLTWNYRNSSIILDYSSEIIKLSKSYIKKQFNPLNRGEMNDVVIKSYNATTEEWYEIHQGKAVYDLLLDLIENKKVEPSEIMILSRYNFSCNKIKEMILERNEIPMALLKHGKMVKPGVRFYTIHKSKGLEADIVIILNVYTGDFGFPSKIESKVNYHFLNPDLTEKSEEEARLCFVGLTRARKKVFLFTWESNESDFILYNFFFNPTSGNAGKIVNPFRAEIIKRTEKAILFCLVDIPTNPTIWFPLSTITQIVQLGDEDLYEIEAEKWIIDKKNQELINKIRKISV